jgi:hypothetical protein
MARHASRVKSNQKMKIHVNDDVYEVKQSITLSEQQVSRLLNNPRAAKDIRDEIAEQLQQQ